MNKREKIDELKPAAAAGLFGAENEIEQELDTEEE